ncbi:SAV_2336 N-terminal domain-related protein [Kitasatospora purpeofusca]|uniref:SAV_2336 N-terminal domain-related protein n=1 Tax=Kitasatospora purpeofusca TaxID=67352 RepID=UPI0022567EB1|nr:SAV_2336 N-terminal domain-related protein [Kitasatospora purpeofusca]MCX4756068.1 SAV_2336 N-terminal domain-related protein [Kitasatospora purpeofusca]WSR36091.1 SAV_2336 family protein [Kitasatospora purpeofusca]WSR44378.1 SAV_2336 family protein [Kitasatospora purpeofusca]
MGSASPGGPAEGLTDALAGLLRQADGGPQPQDLADVLWIAGLAGLLEPPPPPAPPSPPSPPTPPLAMPSVPRPSAAPRPARARPKSTVVPWQSSPPLPAGRTPIGPAPVVVLPPPPPPPPPPVRPPTGPHVALHHRSGSQGRPANPGADEPGNTDRAGGHVIRVTQPAALDGGLALARALRPLRRAVDAPGRATLDEEATAEATAETGILLPVWRPAQQPRFSVDLLVDTGATMAVWHRLAGELSTLLERHGAFADVRCWALDTDRKVPTLAPFHRRRPGAPAAARADWSRPLHDPTDRRILLVLTDGVGPAWYGKELPKFLAGVAAARPTAALQVLPRRLWHRTALRTALVAARASVAGRPVPAFRSDAALPGIPPGSRGAEVRAGIRWLPVLEVDADWITPWADLTAGRTSGWTPMLAAPIAGMPERQRPTRPAGTPATPAERVARFRAGSSPAAYRLACHLAAAPLSLPVMRLVQRAAVPESGQTDLAELFLSGLIAPRGGAATDPDEQVYDFRDGVRKELLAELTRTEAVQVLEHVLTKVSGRVAATFGGTRDFRAVARLVGAGGDGEGDGGEVRLSARSLPFAEVAVTVLASAGGQHAALAARLAEAVTRTARGAGATRMPRPDPPLLRPDRLSPVRPVLSPPEPVRMIGRKRELAALAAAFDPDRAASGPPEQPAVVVVVGDAGTGRRRLVQEYVQAYGGRHSFTHWIDAHSPGSLERGLGQLWSALSPADEPYIASSPAALRDRLERHRDWLVVLDSFPRDGWPAQPGYRFSFEPLGRGCVLVTTGDPQLRPTGATIVELRSLGTADVLDELVARLGPAYDPDDSGQATALRRLAQRLPHIPDVLAETDLDAELARALPAPDPSPPRTRSNEAAVHVTVQGRPVTLRLPAPISRARSGLPVPAPAFTGRAEALAALLSFLAPVEPGQLPTRTAVITGPPGVGKSELVLRAATTVLQRGWYPGGALYLDLRKHPNSSVPSGPHTPAALLYALDVPGEIVPPDPRDQAELFRTVITGLAGSAGPILLVLDNVPPSIDLDPFLPVDGPLTVLVTSRHSQPIAATRFDLRVMTLEDSVQLLRNRLQLVLPDDTRLMDAPRQAAALAELCDGLPLALAICAARLAGHPARPVTTLVQELSDPRRRLDAISYHDRSLKAAFTESYVELSSSAGRLFRLLSVYPYPELSTDVAAGVANLDILVAEQLMVELAQAHLVEPAATQEHWYFHPLLRLYALSLGEDLAGPDDRENALTRLLTHYQVSAEAASVPGSPYSTVRFRDRARARAWLDTEQPIMLALVAFASEHVDTDGASTFAHLVVRLLLADRRFDALGALVERMRAADLHRGDSAGAEWLLRALFQGLSQARIRSEDLPVEHRAALDRLFRVISQEAPTDHLYLAVQTGTGEEEAVLLLDRILSEVMGSSSVDSRLVRPSPGFGADLLLTIVEPADPLATAGRVVLDLCDRLKRLAPDGGPRTAIAVSVLQGPPPERLPGAAQLRRRLRGRPFRRTEPIAALTVSRSVFNILAERFGADMTMFDLVLPGAAEPESSDATYRYVGDPQLLGLILANPSAGRIIES